MNEIMDGGAAGPGKSALAFGILATIQAALIFTIALIMIPLPTIAEELDLREGQVLLLQVAYGLPFSGLLLFGGRLSDRYGARRLLALGLVLFGGSSLAAALSPTHQILVAARFSEGMGGALVAPSAVAALRAVFPDPARFGRAMATWGGVSIMGATLGFISSGIIAEYISWRWMFAVPIAVSAAGLASVANLIPGQRAGGLCKRPTLDPVGALLATSGIILLSYALIVSRESGWSSADVIVSSAISIGLLLAFFTVEARARDPLLPPTFLLDARRAVGLSGVLLAAAGSLLLEYILLIYLQEQGGWSSLRTAVSFIPFAITLIATNSIAPSVVGRIGSIGTTITGFVVAAIGLFLLTRIGTEIDYLGTLLPGQVLVAMGIALAFAGSAVLATANVPIEKMGLAGGVMNTAMELGPTVGFACLMAVAATRGNDVEGYAWAFGTAGAAYCLAAILALLVARGDQASD